MSSYDQMVHVYVHKYNLRTSSVCLSKITCDGVVYELHRDYVSSAFPHCIWCLPLSIKYSQLFFFNNFTCAFALFSFHPHTFPLSSILPYTPSTLPSSFPPADHTALSGEDPGPLFLKGRTLYCQVERNGCCVPSPPSTSRTE